MRDNFKFSDKKKNVCFVSTIAWPLKIYIGPHILKLSKERNVKIFLLADKIKILDNIYFNEDLKKVNIKIVRKINFIYDLFAIINLFYNLKKFKINTVHSIMPKAGLLTMFASYLANTPNRFHTFTGQVWANKKGYKRFILSQLDKFIASLATHVLCDSFSQMNFLIENGVVNKNKISVLGVGSICGIDLKRFAPNNKYRLDVRNKLNINSNDCVFLFVGRLNRDKGIYDLLFAFNKFILKNINVHLIIVGPDEENIDTYINHNYCNQIGKNIHRVDFTYTPEMYMAASDIFCLPSYREGFNNVVLEASSMGIPVIASNINGITDPVINGETGILHKPGDVNELYNAMNELYNNLILRKKLGENGKNRVINFFNQDYLTSEFLEFYKKRYVI